MTICYAALNNQNKNQDDDGGRSVFKGPLAFEIQHMDTWRALLSRLG